MEVNTEGKIFAKPHRYIALGERTRVGDNQVRAFVDELRDCTHDDVEFSHVFLLVKLLGVVVVWLSGEEEAGELVCEAVGSSQDALEAD
jgi:hypothetical protein